MSTPHTPTLGAKRVIRKFGMHIRLARLRRRLPMDIIATRAFISRGTLARVESGDPAVSFGIYASVIQALGLIRSLDDILIDDPVGADLENDRLPQRIRSKKATSP